jgi:hypothetical protein
MVKKEEETLSFEVSDEVLESAAATRWPRLTRSPHAPVSLGRQPDGRQGSMNITCPTPHGLANCQA